MLAEHGYRHVGKFYMKWAQGTEVEMQGWAMNGRTKGKRSQGVIMGVCDSRFTRNVMIYHLIMQPTEVRDTKIDVPEVNIYLW